MSNSSANYTIIGSVFLVCVTIIICAALWIFGGNKPTQQSFNQVDVAEAPAPVVDLPIVEVAPSTEITPQKPNFNDMLQVPELATAVDAALNQLAGITIEGEVSHDKPIYVFFDPRCAYCHQAFTSLYGKFKVKWLPTLALGSDLETAANEEVRNYYLKGQNQIGYILGDNYTANYDGAGVVTDFTLKSDEGMDARLVDSFEDKITGEYPMSDNDKAAIDVNFEMMMTMNRQSNGALTGVPAFFIPRSDGTLYYIDGWDDTTIQRIAEEYQ